MNTFYVYQYLRSSDNTPYYIGKGKDLRYISKQHSISVPKDTSKIEIIAEGLLDSEARELEMQLIKEYGRKNNGTGILRNLTDGGEGRSSKNCPFAAEKKQNILRAKTLRAEKKRLKELETITKKENKCNKRKQKELDCIAKKEARAQLAKQKLDNTKQKQHIVIKKQEKVTCPVCNKRPVGVNLIRNGKTYYRKRCDWCIYNKKHLRPVVSNWVKTGYKKKPHCEKCGFVAKLKEQLVVAYLDGNIENGDSFNLKTICQNCRIEVEKGALPWQFSSVG